MPAREESSRRAADRTGSWSGLPRPPRERGTGWAGRLLGYFERGHPGQVKGGRLRGASVDCRGPPLGGDPGSVKKLAPSWGGEFGQMSLW